VEGVQKLDVIPVLLVVRAGGALGRRANQSRASQPPQSQPPHFVETGTIERETIRKMGRSQGDREKAGRSGRSGRREGVVHFYTSIPQLKCSTSPTFFTIPLLLTNFRMLFFPSFRSDPADGQTRGVDEDPRGRGEKTRESGSPSGGNGWALRPDERLSHPERGHGGSERRIGGQNRISKCSRSSLGVADEEGSPCLHVPVQWLQSRPSRSLPIPPSPRHSNAPAGWKSPRQRL
jgi:hypothetical protein